MDHLPVPVDRDPFIVDVPYVAHQAPTYSETEVGAFLRKYEEDTQPSINSYGMDVDKVEGSDVGSGSPLQHPPYSVDEWIAIAQSWLYFGTLVNVLGQELSWKHFVRKQLSSETLLLSTYWLPALIESKNASLRDAWGRPPNEIGRIRTVLMDAQVRWFRFLLYLRDTGDPHDTTWARVCLAIGVLFTTLDTNICSFRSPDQNPYDFQVYFFKVEVLSKMRSSVPNPAVRLLKDHMLQSGGWCVHQIDNLSVTLPLVTLTYLANLKRHPRPGSSHASCQLSARCVAHNSLNMGLECRHTDDCSGCEHVNASVRDLERILEDGGIPVLSCVRTANGNIVASYIRASPGSKRNSTSSNYAAISHLWADGLGNSRNNSLPHCQLDKILNMVTTAGQHLARQYLPHATSTRKWWQRVGGDTNHIDSTVNLWLDVYCVPVLRPAPTSNAATNSLEDEAPADRARRLKAIAISRMDATYSWASFVLVLDRELARITQAANDMELVARVATCAWNTRCWTYQEHFLAKTTVFQCDQAPIVWRPDAFVPAAERPTTMNETYKAIAGIVPGLVDLTARSTFDTTKYIGRYRIFKIPGRSRSYWHRQRFAKAWNAFRGRSTTQQEDALGIFANLLRLSAAEIGRLAPADQMKAILSAQSELPLALLSFHPEQLAGPGLLNRSPPQWLPDRPGERQLEWRAGGYSMEVTPAGLVLIPASLSTRSYAVLVELPIMHGSKWTFTLPACSNRARDRICWLSLDRQLLDHCNCTARSDRIVILLDFIAVAVGHSAGIGAWLLPSGSKKAKVDCVSYETLTSRRYKTSKEEIACVDYGGPITWGYTTPNEVQEQSSPPVNAEVMTSEKRLLIQEDIESWPKVATNRSKDDFSIFWPLWFLLFVGSLSALGGIFMAATSHRKRLGVWIITSGIGLDFLSGFAICWTHMLSRNASRYLYLHSMHPEYNGAAPWWQRLKKALVVVSKNASISEKVMKILPLWVLTAIPVACARVWRWVRPTKWRTTATRDDEDFVDMRKGAENRQRTQVQMSAV